MRKTYKSYHTSLILQYKFGILSPQIKSQIPSSTLCNWKKRDTDKLLGYEAKWTDEELDTIKVMAQHQRLMQIARALVNIIQCYQLIYEKSFNSKQALEHFGQSIINSIEYSKHALGKARCLKLFSLSKSQFQYWKNRLKTCTKTYQQICLKAQPNQLLLEEVQQIRKYLMHEDYATWSLSSIYYQGMRDAQLFCGKSTFYKYARLLGISKIRPQSRRKKHRTGIRANRVCEWLHMDVTIFKPLNGYKVYLYVVQDNFSRNILTVTASLKYTAQTALDNLKKALSKVNANMLPSYLLTDGGSENLGDLNHFVHGHPQLTQQIAQQDIHFSNSMVKAANKHLNYHYLFTKPYENFDEVQQDIPDIENNYNNKSLAVLHGLTPSEVFEDDLTPNPKRFEKEKAQAKLLRMDKNRQNRCEECK